MGYQEICDEVLSNELVAIRSSVVMKTAMKLMLKKIDNVVLDLNCFFAECRAIEDLSRWVFMEEVWGREGGGSFKDRYL